MTRKERGLPTGLRHPPPPSDDLDKVGVVKHYLDHFESEFARTRGEAKKRSRRAVVWQALLGGGATVVSATAAALSTEVLPTIFGVLVALISATAAGIAVWDGHFRHEQLWVQRTLVLGEITRVRIAFEVDRRSDESRATAFALSELNRVLRLDISTWMALRGAEASGGVSDPLLPEASVARVRPRK
jgi:hypothetical protein